MKISMHEIAPDVVLTLRENDALLGTRGEALFSGRELACKLTGACALDPKFAIKLLSLRMTWARPMRVASCCRAVIYNRQVGGHPHSLHVYDQPFHDALGTAAIDVAISGSEEAAALARMAIAQGWSLGVPKSGFLHLDNRLALGLPQGLFGY